MQRLLMGGIAVACLASPAFTQTTPLAAEANSSATSPVQIVDDPYAAEKAAYVELPSSVYSQPYPNPKMDNVHFTIISYSDRQTGGIRTFLEGELIYVASQGLGLDVPVIGINRAAAKGGTQLIMENEPVEQSSCGSPSRAVQITFCTITEKIAVAVPIGSTTGSLSIQLSGRGSYKGYVVIPYEAVQRTRSAAAKR